jgi:uncharacterized Zn finger protein
LGRTLQERVGHNKEGLRSFEDPDCRLRAFLADRYLEAGRIAEALEQRWANFQDRPSLDAYHALLAAASRGKEAPSQRGRALDHLRERFEKGRGEASRWNRPNLDLLVQVHLYEKEPLEGLKAARTGGCHHDTWLVLAERLEESLPQEALRILQEQLDAIIAPTGDEAYRHATATLVRIRNLAERMNQPGAFAATLASVMTTHGRKRNLVARMKKAGLV